MKNFGKILLLAGLGFTTMNAHAIGLFVEPGVTYERGDGDLDFPSPFGDTDADVNGFGVMARLGVHIIDTVWVAADGRYSQPQVKNDDYDAKATAFNYGLTAGIQMPTLLGLRVWGGYILGGEMDPEKDENLDVKFTKGTGYRVGAGIQLLLLSINLEYQDMKYGDAELEELGPFAVNESFNDVDATNKSYVLSVSFPVSF